jgi:hypothetical protein
MEPHWLTSGHDLQLGIVAELDAYLQENFSPGKHIRSEVIKMEGARLASSSPET